MSLQRIHLGTTLAFSRGIDLTCVLRVPRHLRQEENQFLACPPDVARTLSPTLQALVGYTMPGTSFGYFAEYQHPREALQTDAAAINWAARSACSVDAGSMGADDGNIARLESQSPRL